MRLTIISPLFPPDTAPSAVYTKVLLSKLYSATTIVTGVVYGQLPESVPDVTITSVPKRHHVGWRLFRMVQAIRTKTASTDVFLICNGPSAEVPFLISRLLTRTPYIFIISDEQAAKASSASLWKNKVLQYLKQNAIGTFEIGGDILYYCPPEIHPLLPHPYEAIKKWNTTWETHQTEILQLVYDKQ